MAVEGWMETYVKNILSLMRNGYSCQQTKDGHGCPVTRIETIADAKINYDKVGYAEIPIDQKEKYQLKLGDILFSHINSVKHIGKVAIYNGEHELYHGMNLMLLRADKEICMSAYLHYLLSTPRAKEYFETTCKQAINQASLNSKDIGNYPVSLPPIIEQEKIAEILGSVDEAIAKTEAVITQTQKVKQGLLQTLLTKGIGHTKFKQTEIGEIPEGWEVKKVGSVLTHIDSGWSPNCETVPAGADEWGVLKTTSVVWEGFSEIENKALPSNLLPRPDIEVKPSDVLVTRAGPVERVAVVVHVDFVRSKLMLSDKIIRLRADENQCLSKYLAYFLSGYRAQSHLIGRKTGMAESQTNISQQGLKETPLALPSIKEQSKICTVLDKTSARLLKEGAFLEGLKKFKKGLMSDLLTGRVRVKLDKKSEKAA